MKVAVFSTKPYDRRFLEAANRAAGHDLDVIEPPIPKSIRFAEAPAAGRSILKTSRTNKGAQAYREVATGLLNRV